MAYDKEKAHEYYIKYRKKGLKKGRKKGRKKTGTSTSLVGVSTSGLNDDGRIAAGIIKDRIKKEMNEALSKAKTDAERDNIRMEYSKKAQAEISKLKSDPKYAKPKSAKASKSGGGSSKASKAPKASNASGGKTSKSNVTSGTKQKAQSASAKSQTPSAIDKKTIIALKNQIESLREMIPDLTSEQKTRVVNTMKAILKTLKEAKGLSAKEEARYNANIEDNTDSGNAKSGT